MFSAQFALPRPPIVTAANKPRRCCRLDSTRHRFLFMFPVPNLCCSANGRRPSPHRQPAESQTSVRFKAAVNAGIIYAAQLII